MRDPWSNHVEPELKIENKVINDPVKYLIYQLKLTIQIIGIRKALNEL